MLDLLEEVVLALFEKRNRLIGAGKLKVETDIYSLHLLLQRDLVNLSPIALNIPIGKTRCFAIKTKSILENLIDWFSKK
jgi:hypothetical protein